MAARMKQYVLFGLIMMIQTLVVLDMMMFSPLGVLITQRLQVSPEVLVYLNIGYIASGLLAPLFSVPVRKIGMIKTVIICGLIFVIGVFIAGFANHWVQFVVGRMFTGITYYTLLALLPVLSLRILENRHTEMVMGGLKLSFALGVFAAPLYSGALLGLWGFSGLYLVLGLSMVFMITVFAIVGHVGLSAKPSEPVRLDLQQSTSKKHTLWMIIAFLSPIHIVMMVNYYGVELSRLGMEQDFIQKAFSAMGIGSLISVAFILLFTKKIGKDISCLIGVTVQLIALFLIFRFAHFMLFIILALYFFGYDLFSGVFFVKVSEATDDRDGAVLTQVSMHIALGMMAASLIAPMTYTSFGYGFHQVISIGMTFVILILYLWNMVKGKSFR